VRLVLRYLLVVLVVLGGCTDPPLRDEEGASQVEGFAEVQLPPSTDDLQVYFDEGPLDSELYARFAIDEADLEAFADSLTAPLEPGLRGVYTTPPDRADWDLDTIDSANIVGARDHTSQGHVREVMVDLSNAARPVVYLRTVTV
jgi:hypothetical protein